MKKKNAGILVVLTALLIFMSILPAGMIYGSASDELAEGGREAESAGEAMN